MNHAYHSDSFATPDATATSVVVVTADARPSLDLAIAVWLDAKRRRTNSVKTEQAYRTTLDSFRATLHTQRLDLNGQAQLVALVAQAWAYRRAGGEDGEESSGATVSPSTVNQRLAILSSFYAFGMRRGLLVDATGAPLTTNPIDQVDRQPVQQYAGARPLATQTVEERLAAIDTATLLGLRDFALLSLALTTGRRANELLALDWGDLLIQSAAGRGARRRNAQAGPARSAERIHVTWRRCKGGKVMQDDLQPGTAAALLRYLYALHGAAISTLAPPTPIFVALDGARFARRVDSATAGDAQGPHLQRLTRQGLSKVYARRLGTTKIHTTRHTFARNMEEAGAKVSDIQQRLGHASLATTSRYLAELVSGENPYAGQLEEWFGIAPPVVSHAPGTAHGVTQRRTRPS